MKNERFRPILTMFRKSFKADFANTLLSVVLFVISALSAPLFAVLLGALANSAAQHNSNTVLLTYAFLLAATAGIGIVVREVAWKVVQIAQERTSHLLDIEILNAVMSVPGIEHHERPEYLDNLSHLRNEHWVISQGISMLLSSVTILVQIIATCIVLAAIHPLLLLLMLCSAPEIWANGKAEKIRMKGMMELREEWRRSDNALDLIVGAGPAKEVRVFGLANEIIARHADSSRKSYDREFSDRLRGVKWILGSRLFFALAYIGGLAFVTNEAIHGRESIGMLLATMALTGSIVGQLGQAARYVTWYSYAQTAVKRYLWVMDYQADAIVLGTNTAPERLENGIRLDHVAFTYPGTEHQVLEDVDVFLPAGKTIAIIGDNGAGKSTLIKLLTRMYEPTTGSIVIDDTPLTDIDPALWRDGLSAAFQDHAKLELVASESVGVGDLPQVADVDVVNRAVSRGGAVDVVERLPQKLETQLGAQWDGGVDLSGGQWQKLALARGMMRDPLLLVLDEPTSALDAETEHALFERFAEATRTRTKDSGTITVLVSHRFSTVRMADIIIVLSGGKVVETGSHHELMTKAGLYAELYEMQARASR
jgi:ATP-binding cassette, subfamily B, bacterial